MIRSMTGFGKGESSSNGYQVTVELKTLNSRYLDTSIRAPSSLSHHELDIRELIQTKLSRGKVHFTANVDKTDKSQPKITFDGNMVKAYANMLREIHQLAGITEPINLSDILKFDELFTQSETDDATIEGIWEITKTALQIALDQLNVMREQEGQELKKDLIDHIRRIEQIVTKVEELSSNRAPEIREKLRTRIQSLLTDETFDESRLETEIALMADKMDINEEVTRLRSHLKFFMQALESDVPVGRRLNFLSQEINRELNTIGSKCNDSEISQYIVLGKENLEQIREQVQNIE